MNVPKLRFKEFNKEWKKEKFKQFSYYSGKRNKNNLSLIPYAITNINGFVPQNEAHNEFGYMKNTNREAYNIVTPKSFAYNPARINVGSIGYYNGTEDIIVSSLYEVFKTTDYIDDNFLWFWLKSNKLSIWINKLQEGSVRQYFYYDKLCETPLYFPNINEQIKISKLLSLLDKKIELQTRKIEDLKLFKKGLINHIIENIEIEKIPLKYILVEQNNKTSKNNEYEILSSTSKGIYLQKDYFNKQAASDNNVGYKILKKNQLVLSPQNLWMGNINVNTEYNIGIVSPSYKIFNISNNVNIDFFNYWIKSPKALFEYKISSEQGASIVRRNLNMDLFYEIIVDVPRGKLQNKVGKIIKLLNLNIQYNEFLLQKLSELKKGLMQNMFV